MEPLIAILITIIVMFGLWLALRERKCEGEFDKCEHDECAECHHLIAKGSGQVVEVILVGYSVEKQIHCDLHKKPYDKVTQYYFCDTPHQYWKKMEWKRVNEDGTDYKEPEITVNSKNIDKLIRGVKKRMKNLAHQER